MLCPSTDEIQEHGENASSKLLADPGARSKMPPPGCRGTVKMLLSRIAIRDVEPQREPYPRLVFTPDVSTSYCHNKQHNFWVTKFKSAEHNALRSNLLHVSFRFIYVLCILFKDCLNSRAQLTYSHAKPCLSADRPTLRFMVTASRIGKVDFLRIVPAG